eukprot:TRINITY_DN37873_c0_g1_i1.p1 TRINITY_DN37873_c0_g1~~TRINITY_DN37873_c0_g1_i1.p1  ORF type:complete len:276 (+),score=51.89 TRINITY_DN37873_c0_g1_i1:85-912(+)
MTSATATAVTTSTACEHANGTAAKPLDTTHGGWRLVSLMVVAVAIVSGNFDVAKLLPVASSEGAAASTHLPSAQLLPPWDAPAAWLQDHSFLVTRVMEEHEWSKERADVAIVEYLRFMQLLAEAPRMELVASSDVDLVWHEHILDTINYAKDSEKLWGRFLHHRRARTSEEVAAIPAGYEYTKQVYQQRFGREAPKMVWGATTDSSSMCGGGGGNVDPSDSGPRTAAPSQTQANGGATTTLTTSKSSMALAQASVTRHSAVLLAVAALVALVRFV